MAETVASSPDKPAQRNYDSFFLKHLQSVRSESGNYYQNQRFVGKGGNGTTFLVTCTSGTNQGMQFALKVFHKISDERRRQRFLEEIRHYRSLTHPAIIKVHDEGNFSAGERTYPFAVVDYVPENFEAVIGRGAPHITRLQAIRYVYNVASGVCFLHAQEHPIVHRDIKPANILIHGGSARLGDLGLAKVLMGTNEKEEAEEVAAYAAMPHFHRTPELVAIARKEAVALTPASDIYQLGLVLYRALTGFNPQKEPESVTDDIQLDVRLIAGACGDRLNSLIGRMLAPNPEHRFTAVELLRELNIVHRDLCEADLAATGMMR